MASQKSIDIISRGMPGVEVLEDAPASDMTHFRVPLTKQLSVEEQRRRRSPAGERSVEKSEPADTQGRIGGVELVRVKLSRGLHNDARPQVCSVVVSKDDNEIVGAQG